jgi:arylsulfatase A-like enzyme
MPPNVLWIVFDTARADALEPYGAPSGATPVVADLARRGTALPEVRSTACWTLPAHLSMFAGGLPRRLGLANQAGLTPVNTGPIVEALRDRLIAEVLRRSGYRTAGVSTNAWISGHSGFGTGFDQFHDTRHPRQARMAAPGRRAHARWLAEAAVARVDDGAAEAERVLGRWLSARPVEPFFWFVNLVECHSPYLPPRPYTELSMVDRVRAAEEARLLLTMEAFWRACVTREPPPPDALARMRAGYRGAVRSMDDWMGRLLERLDRRGLMDRTLIMVSSDHGENFGEDGLIGHGFSLDERLIHAPFVVAGPGADQLRGVRSFTELPGRLAIIAEVADHPYDPADVPPIPVAQFDPPVPARDDPRTDAAIAQWGLDDVAAARLTTSLTAAVDGDVKLVAQGETEAFYDLAADPLESAPVPVEQVDPAAVARLREVLRHETSSAEDVRLPDGAASAPPTPTPKELADIEDHLRTLGYL